MKLFQKFQSSMKAVILAAGAGTRVAPLNENFPKHLIPVAGKPTIYHNFDAVCDFVDEIIVVQSRERALEKAIGSNYNGRQISYVVQEVVNGTGGALKQLAGKLGGRFIVLMGDDIYSKEDVAELIKHDLAIGVMPTSEIYRFGSVKEESGRLSGLVEKPKDEKEGLANTGLYLLNDSIFSELQNLEASPRGEIELTDAVLSLADKKRIDVVKIREWIPVAYPWDLLAANEKLLAKMRGKIKGVVESGATLKGEVHLGKDSIIRSGSYIEGPVWIGEGSDIGPNCYIRPATYIGDRCRVGNACEIKNSIIMNGTHAGHLSYIGDSIMGESCNLGAGTIIANLRHDGQPVKMGIKGERISTGRRKMGAVFGHGVKTGINVSVRPGVKIKSGAQVPPHIEVQKDVE